MEDNVCACPLLRSDICYDLTFRFQIFPLIHVTTWCLLQISSQRRRVACHTGDRGEEGASYPATATHILTWHFRLLSTILLLHTHNQTQPCPDNLKSTGAAALCNEFVWEHSLFWFVAIVLSTSGIHRWRQPLSFPVPIYRLCMTCKKSMHYQSKPLHCPEEKNQREFSFHYKTTHLNLAVFASKQYIESNKLGVIFTHYIQVCRRLR